MNKSGTLIASALLTLGLAAGAMAADTPNAGAPTATETPSSSTMPTDPAKHTKKHKSKKKKASAPSTTK